MPAGAGRAWLRSQLADACLRRFNLTGDVADLEEVVTLHQEGIDVMPPDGPDRVVALAVARRTLSKVDLDRIPAHLRAHLLFDRAALLDPDNLAAEAAVWLRYAEQADRTSALDVAIWLLQQALPGFARESDEWLDATSDLANALAERGRRTGTLADIDEAIRLDREVLTVAPPGQPRRPGFWSNLATSLRYRFARTGKVADLDTGIETARNAVDAAAGDHPRRALYLTNLASQFMDRYDQMGSLTDLHEAVRVDRQAIAATDADDPNRARNLSNFGSAILERAQVVGSRTDAGEAVDALNEALSLTRAEHPDRAGRLQNLGLAYRVRYGLTGETADLEQAIRHHRQAVVARADGDPDLPRSLTGLGASLGLRAELTRDIDHLNEAVDVLTQAVHAVPPGHPERASCLSNLGRALRARYEATGNRDDAEAAIRLAAAQRWAALAMSLPGQHASGLAGYAAAADLLHLVAWRGLTRSDREHALTDWAHLPGDMAGCAFRGRPRARPGDAGAQSRSALDPDTRNEYRPVCRPRSST